MTARTAAQDAATALPSGRAADAERISSCRVAVVVPAYRARDTIERVVRRALDVADVVIVVDDACPDRSGAAVCDLDPRVRVLRHEVNRGVGGATKTGIAEALRLGAEYVVKVLSLIHI